MKLNKVPLTKAQEVEQLKDMAASVEPGSYLDMLFTPKMISWCEAQINQDFPPDLHDAMQVDVTRNQDLRCKLQDAELRLTLAKEQLVKEEEEVEALRAVARNSAQAFEAMQEDRDQWKSDCLSTRAELESNAAHYQDELTRLKAKLYDLSEQLGKV